VLLLDVRNSTLMERLAGRRICPKCGTVYNIHSMPPGATGCSKDGAELYQRPDDKEEVIGKRLEVYEQQTRPLVDYYTRIGLLRTVEGEGELEEVFERMESAALTRGAPEGAVKVRKSKPQSKPQSKPKAAAQKAMAAPEAAEDDEPAPAAAPKPAVAKTRAVPVKKAAAKTKTKTKTATKKKAAKKKAAKKKAAKAKKPAAKKSAAKRPAAKKAAKKSSARKPSGQKRTVKKKSKPARKK